MAVGMPAIVCFLLGRRCFTQVMEEHGQTDDEVFLVIAGALSGESIQAQIRMSPHAAFGVPDGVLRHIDSGLQSRIETEPATILQEP